MIALNIQESGIVSMLLILARCSGIFVFTPFLGSANIPVQARVVLSFVISYVFSLSVSLPPIPYVPSITSLLFGVAGELFIGLVIGFAAHALFAGLQFAGQLIGFHMGLSLVNTIDPQSATRSTALAVYQNYLGTMIFLGLNGHHWIIRAVYNSLTVVPPYSIGLNAELMQRLVGFTSQLFVIGFELAAPVVAVVFLTDFVMGVIGRSAPQLQIMMIGLPLKVLVGLSGLGLALYFFPAAMRTHFGQFHGDLDGLVRSMRK
jgi:flagellar biosynthetic protein FliR